MAWSIEWDHRAAKEFKKLDKTAQRNIQRYLRERIAPEDDPRRFGKALKSNFSGLWRYRVEDYRLICRIEDESITILILRVAHRKEAYE